MTIAELQKEFLSSGSAHIAPEDFFILLAYATGREKTFLLSHPEYVIDAESESRARDSFSRRLRHEPVAYIVGHKEFYGLDFSVTPDTLIPRPETELLVERTFEKIRSGNKKRILIADIGTGSGNIIISIASTLIKEDREGHPRFAFSATDISEQAIAVAKKNAERHDVSSIIEFHTGDLFEPIREKVSSADEIIIMANLPYLSEEIYQTSDDDVKKFEPRSALLSGQTGLDHYSRLFDQIRDIPKPMTLFLEIGPEQARFLHARIITDFPKAAISIHQDLAGRDRIVEIRR